MIARHVMLIAASSADAERAFSTAGDIVTPLRSSLKPARVNMLAFLASNAHSGSLSTVDLEGAIDRTYPEAEIDT